jgi:hypothetical protein
MHHLSLVVLPPGDHDIEDAVDRVMAGETASTYADFEVRCYCPGETAWSAGYAEFDASPRGLEIRVELDLLSEGAGAQDTERRGALLGERYRAALRIASTRDDFEKPDPACDVCHGTGTHGQSRNPADHFDWWVIGGRWEGILGREGTNVERHVIGPDPDATRPWIYVHYMPWYASKAESGSWGWHWTMGIGIPMDRRAADAGWRLVTSRSWGPTTRATRT